MSTGHIASPSGVVTFSNSSALPPCPWWCGSVLAAASDRPAAGDLLIRSAISVISSMQLTGAVTRCSSPAASRAATKD